MLHGKMFNPNLRGIFPRLLYKYTTIIHYKYGLIHFLYTLKWNGHQQIDDACIFLCAVACQRGVCITVLQY